MRTAAMLPPALADRFARRVETMDRRRVRADTHVLPGGDQSIAGDARGQHAAAIEVEMDEAVGAEVLDVRDAAAPVVIPQAAVARDPQVLRTNADRRRGEARGG